MSYVTNLKCRECGQEYPISPLHVCEDLLRPARSQLRLRQNPRRDLARDDRTAARTTSGAIANCCRSRANRRSGRFPALRRCCMPSGSAPSSGLKKLYIKDDTVNHPTLSYKDRVVSVAISKAREFGFTTVSCASTGNLATAVAAHAARAGLNCVIFMPEGVEIGQNRRLDDLRRAGDHDSRQLRRRQSAVQRNRRQVRLGLRQYQPAPVLYRGRQDLRLRGRRTTRLAHCPTISCCRPPAARSCPRSPRPSRNSRRSACCASSEFKIHCAQAAGSAPVIHALHKGTDLITPVKPDTIAKSIAIGNPADGFYVLRAVRESGGWGDDGDRPRDHRRDQAARAHRGHLRRAGRRHHARRHDEAHRRRSASSPTRAWWSVDHRQRLQDAGGGRADRSSSRS